MGQVYKEQLAADRRQLLDTLSEKCRNSTSKKKAELMKWASHWHEQAKPHAEGTKAP